MVAVFVEARPHFKMLWAAYTEHEKMTQQQEKQVAK
jgi:hypothetical protein